MKHYYKVILPVLCLLAAACAPMKQRPDVAGVDPKLFKQFDDSYKCVAFYDAYATYLQPSYPDQAKQYAQYADQNGATTFIWLMSKYKASTPSASEGQLASASAGAYSARVNLWQQFLQTSNANDIQGQVQACNSYSPQIDWGNKKLQQSPNYQQLLNLYQQTKTNISRK